VNLSEACYWLTQHNRFVLVLCPGDTYYDSTLARLAHRLNDLDSRPWGQLDALIPPLMEKGSNSILWTNSPAVVDRVPWESAEWLQRSLLVSPDGEEFYALSQKEAEECMAAYAVGIQQTSAILEEKGLLRMSRGGP
jgi:hypothetical protein